jgi:hypothetical protein
MVPKKSKAKKVDVSANHLRRRSESSLITFSMCVFEFTG